MDYYDSDGCFEDFDYYDLNDGYFEDCDESNYIEKIFGQREDHKKHIRDNVTLQQWLNIRHFIKSMDNKSDILPN